MYCKTRSWFLMRSIKIFNSNVISQFRCEKSLFDQQFVIKKDLLVLYWNQLKIAKCARKKWFSETFKCVIFLNLPVDFLVLGLPWNQLLSIDNRRYHCIDSVRRMSLPILLFYCSWICSLHCVIKIWKKKTYLISILQVTFCNILSAFPTFPSYK